MTHTYKLTSYQNLLNTHGTTSEYTWETLIHVVFRHDISFSKETVPLFGPYALPPGTTRRENKSVDALTLAVFDVDTGTEAEVDACQQLLAFRGIQTFWYT